MGNDQSGCVDFMRFWSNILSTSTSSNSVAFGRAWFGADVAGRTSGRVSSMQDFAT